MSSMIASRASRPRRKTTLGVKSVWTEDLTPAGGSSDICTFNMAAGRDRSRCSHSDVLWINRAGGRAGTEMGAILGRADASGVCRAAVIRLFPARAVFRASQRNGHESDFSDDRAAAPVGTAGAYSLVQCIWHPA